MKGRKIEPLARRHVLPVLPGFAARGGLVYRPPVDYLLRGLWFDTSGFTSSRIYVTAFVQPLFHSYQHLRFSYGFRLGNDFWDVDEADPDPSFAAIAEEVQRHAVPFFDQVTDLDRLCALIPQWDKADPKKIMRDHSLDDPVVMQDLAHAAIVRGNSDRAVELLGKAIASENESGEYGNDERVAELGQMLGLLQDSGVAAAKAQLDRWHARMVASLKL